MFRGIQREAVHGLWHTLLATSILFATWIAPCSTQDTTGIVFNLCGLTAATELGHVIDSVILALAATETGRGCLRATQRQTDDTIVTSLQHWNGTSFVATFVDPGFSACKAQVQAPFVDTMVSYPAMRDGLGQLLSGELPWDNPSSEILFAAICHNFTYDTVVESTCTSVSGPFKDSADLPVLLSGQGSWWVVRPTSAWASLDVDWLPLNFSDYEVQLFALSPDSPTFVYRNFTLRDLAINSYSLFTKSSPRAS